MTEEKRRKELRSLIRFHSANKIDNYSRGRKRGKRKKKKFKTIYRTSQNVRIINVFLESLLSRVLPCWESQSTHLPRMPSNTALISGPAVGAAQILIWSCSYVFLPLMSTAVRTSVLSFVGALSDLFYIP